MTRNDFTSFLQRTFAGTGIKTQTELASVLHINRAAISMAKKKDRVPEKWALQLGDMYGLNPRWLLRGQEQQYAHGTGGEKMLPVPKVQARLCAGAGSFETSATVRETLFFPREWVEHRGNPKEMVLMDIIGNSMEPELRDGDTVLVDQSQTDLLPGALYALAIQDTLLIKRIEQRQADTIALISTNPEYKEMVLRGDELDTMRILGRILWASREYH